MWTRGSGKNDGDYHHCGSADYPGPADGRHAVVGLPAGRTEARNEAGETGKTSVESPKGAEFVAERLQHTF